MNISTTKDQKVSETVENHYNKLEETGLAARTQSRIFYMRNFNNWIKSQLISKYLQQYRQENRENSHIAVLDIGSGKGGDMLKWKKGNIDTLVCADIASTSVTQSRERYEQHKSRSEKEKHSKLFKAHFVTADCTKTMISQHPAFPNKIAFDLVSVQFVIHYSFESFSQANKMLFNISEKLKCGGYFIGTMPDCYEIIKRLRSELKNGSTSFGNEVYKIKFEKDIAEKLPLFGAKYDFFLDGVVNCPEFLVYFPCFEKLAKRYGLELVFKQNFAEFFKSNLDTNDGHSLIRKMQALEPYPSANDVKLVGKEESDYEYAKQHIESRSKEEQPHKRIGTLSKAEWDAATIYMVFCFKKITKPD